VIIPVLSLVAMTLRHLGSTVNCLFLALLPITLGHAQTLTAEHVVPFATGARRALGATAKDALSGKTQSRVFPRILAGVNWETNVVLFNPASTTVTFQQLFIGVDGKMVPFTVHSQGGSGDQTTSGIRGVLPPNSSLSLVLSCGGGIVCEGWSLITYDDGQGVVDGYAILRRKGLGGAFSFDVTVPLSSMQDYSEYMPFDNTQGFRSQLTLVNPAGNIAAQVRLTYLNPQGTVVLLDLVLIPPAQQMTLTLPDIYPDLANKTGTVLVEADTDTFAVLGIRYNETYGAIAPLPTVNGIGMPSQR